MSEAPASTRVPPPRRRVFLPRTAGERVRGGLWRWLRPVVFRWTPPGLDAWRRLVLRAFGARIAASARLAPSMRVHAPWNLRIGPRARVEAGAIVDCMGRVEIGADAVVGRRAHLCAGTHDYRRPDMRIERCPIALGAGAAIGPDAFIGPGVTVGAGARVAARSAVFRDVPAGATWTGEPARPVEA